MRRRRVATIVASAVTLLLAGVALAGKPTSSLSLVFLAEGARSAPAWGTEITFDVSTTETDRPFVNVRCYQGGAFVYDGWHGFFESYRLEPTFTLASTYWTSGAADCTARLVEWTQNGRERTLATLDFAVTA